MLAILLNVSGCAFEFESDIEPLVLPDAPPGYQPGSVEQPEGDMSDLGAEQVAPSGPFGDITSADAIALCQELEYFGDENVGSCLAPGGDTYFVWLAPDRVIQVDRDDPFLYAFRSAALNRDAEETKSEELVSKVPGLILIPFEVLAVGGTCGGAIASALTGVGILLSALLASGCVGSLAAFGYTAVQITQDAEALVNSLVDRAQLDREARYNYCRMEGFSDAECRDREG